MYYIKFISYILVLNNTIYWYGPQAPLNSSTLCSQCYVAISRWTMWDV